MTPDTTDRQTDLSKEDLLALGEAHGVQGLQANMREDTLERKLDEAGVALPKATPQPGDPSDAEDSADAQTRDDDPDAPQADPDAGKGRDVISSAPPAIPGQGGDDEDAKAPEPGDPSDAEDSADAQVTSADPARRQVVDPSQAATEDLVRARDLINQILAGRDEAPAAPPEPDLLDQVQALPIAAEHDVSRSKAIKAAQKAGAKFDEDRVAGVTVRRNVGPDGNVEGKTGVVVIDDEGGKHPAWL